ncbi:regulatory LuxR family protein [Homoserinimonas aerilata]|uniref:Regulatory LuxR family protein n=1 Tax=Homoserinimonas aerilata TaxID=1162970 RepID=A0A542YLL6_9MICO|nr:LuxR C-terminal-related transcriptional regulator [Homoserinimonas aerilata]TQL48834.1 regulatory LuxR family protein [Homoserinimonas aerilata]
MYKSIDSGTFVLQSIDDRAQAQDYPTALRMLERHWPLLAELQGDAVRALITRIPEREWADDPAILAALGASYGTSGSQNRSAALPWFDSAERMARRDAPAQLPGILLHRAATLRALGRLDDAASAIDEAEALLAEHRALIPSMHITLQARAAAQKGMVLLHRGRYDDASALLVLATDLESELGAAELVECRSALALIAAVSGEYARSEEESMLAHRTAGDDGLMQSHFGAPAVIAEAMIAVRRLRLADAVALNPALGVIGRLPEWQAFARYAQAAISSVNGRGIEALELARRALEAARTWQGDVVVRSHCAGLRATVLLQLGDLEAALDAAKSVDPGANHEQCTARHIAGVRLRQGDPAGALEALASCDELGDGHSVRTLLDTLLLTAAARYDLGSATQGHIAFDRALHLAGATGMRSPFISLPQGSLRRMLGRAFDRNQPASVHAILEELRGDDDIDMSMNDPLSERELVITHHLALDKTVSQIAAELFISTNTVKTHVRSIYRKLEASNRKEALLRVQELGLRLEITPG